MLLAAAMLLTTACNRTAINATNDEHRSEIDSVVRSTLNPDSLLNIIKAYKTTKDLLGEAMAYRALGKVHRDNSNFTEAIKYHEQGVRLATNATDTIELVQNLNNLSTDYRRLGMLDMASEYHYNALNLCMQYTDKTSDLARKNLTISLNGLGNVHLQLGNDEVADSIFRIALATERSLGSALGMAINYANLGAVFENRGMDDSAHVYYQYSLDYNRKAGSALGIGLCHNHFGMIAERKGLISQAIGEYLTAYDMLEKCHDEWHWLDPCLSLAKIYISRQQYEQARNYLDQAFTKATSIGSNEHLETIHKLYYELEQQKGNTASALTHYIKSTNYRDSIFNLHALNQIQNMRVGIERQRSENQLKLMTGNLKLERQQKVTAYVLLILLMLTALVGTLFLLYSQRVRKKHEQFMRTMQEARERFFTNITHEFRTPLTAILGMSEQLRSGQAHTPTDVAHAAGIINRQGNHLLQLINQLLDIAKLKSNTAEADWTHGNIVAFTQMVVECCRPIANKKNQRLIYTPQDSVIEMDFVPDYYDRVVTNLLSNAFKFTPEGGTIRLETVMLPNQHLRLSIIDTGIGIAPEALSHIFEPFYQADEDHHNIGTGIGLSLTRQLIEAMDGNIKAESQVGKGTTMTAFLPLRHGKQQPQLFRIDDYMRKPCNDEAENDSLQAEEQSDSNAEQVLIIEDNNDVAYFIGQQLKSTYNVSYASNGDEGLEKARQLIPDIIITDLMMPGTDGIEVCRQVRQNELINHIPIIVVTAKATDKARVEGLQAGADAFLVKPFNTSVLLVTIQQLLEQRRVLREKFTQAISEGTAPDIKMKPSDRTFVDKVRSIVLELMDQGQVDAETLASNMFVSRVHLNRKLQMITGQTTSNIISQIRISRAKKLLDEHPEMSVSQIAMKCGYEDVAYFSRNFKQITNYSPTQYRKRNSD